MYSVYHNSHNASVSAGIPVPFQMHYGNCDMEIVVEITTSQFPSRI